MRKIGVIFFFLASTSLISPQEEIEGEIVVFDEVSDAEKLFWIEQNFEEIVEEEFEDVCR